MGKIIPMSISSILKLMRSLWVSKIGIIQECYARRIDSSSDIVFESQWMGQGKF